MHTLRAQFFRYTCLQPTRHQPSAPGLKVHISLQTQVAMAHQHADIQSFADFLRHAVSCKRCSEPRWEETSTHCWRCELAYETGVTLRESTYDIVRQQQALAAAELNIHGVSTAQNNSQIAQADKRAEDDDEDWDESRPCRPPKAWQQKTEDDIERALLNSTDDESDDDADSDESYTNGSKRKRSGPEKKVGKVKQEQPGRKGKTRQRSISDNTTSTKDGKEMPKKMRIVDTDPTLVDPETPKGRWQKKYMDDLEKKFDNWRELSVPFSARVDPKTVAAYFQWMLIKCRYNMGHLSNKNGVEKCAKDGIPFKYPRYMLKFMLGVDGVREPLFRCEADFMRPDAARDAIEWTWPYARHSAVGKRLNGTPWDELSASQKETLTTKYFNDQMHGFHDFVKLLKQARVGTTISALLSQVDVQDSSDVAKEFFEGGLGAERMVRYSSDVTPLPGDEQESMEDQGVFALAAAQKADHADADDWHDEDDALLNMLR